MSYRYAGLEQVHVSGLSVAEAVERLCRFAYVEQRLMRLFAARIVTIPERDIKVLMGRLQYEESLHTSYWRERVLELRTPKSKLERVPDASLERFFDEAEEVPETYPFLAVVTKLINPALRDAYQNYLHDTNGVADYSSVRLVRQNLLDEEEHFRLLSLALDDLAPVATAEAIETATRYEHTLASYLAAAGGIDGTQPRIDLQSLPSATETRRARKTYHIPRTLMRDETLPRVWDFVKPPLESVEAHLNYMMSIRLSEVNVAEGLAIVLCEQPDMPWSFYADISRHCWDEMRHSIFGEVAIEATYGDRATLALRDYEGIYALEAPPLEQYTVLGLEVEGQNMRYPPGKRQEWEFARDMARHPLMTTLQDFDWADEVLHVNIARRQLDTWFEGGLVAIRDFAKAGKANRTAVKARQSPSPLPSPQAKREPE
jgi:hypothetical protein